MLRDELEDFNIFTLREYARRTGVSSPTSKKKEVLIDEIMDIVEGRKAPSASNKFGRPPKEFHADVFGVRSQGNIVNAFNQESQTFDYSVFKDGRVKGYLEQNNNNFLLNVLVDGKILTHFVPYEISNKYDLRVGDQLCVEISKHGANLMIDELVAINGIMPKNFNNLRPNFDNLKHISSNTSLFDYRDKSLSVTAGDIVYIKGMSNINNSIRLIDIMNKSNRTKNVYINISLLNKTKVLLERFNGATTFTATITDDIGYSRKIVEIACDYVQRLAETGCDVLLGIDDMMSIEKLPNGSQLSRKILSLAKNSSEAGSVSLLCIMPCDDGLREYDKLSDKTLWLE